MDEDTPETVYECPVCLEGLPLNRMSQHIGNHIRLHKELITKENEDHIRGLLDVIKQVVDNPKSAAKKPKERVEMPERYFTQYWTNETWRREAIRLDDLDHTAGNQFRKKGIRAGDVIYIITIFDGKMFLGGKLVVDQVVGKQMAAEILDTSPGMLWDAKDHVLADDEEYLYSFDPDNEVPWDIAKGICIKNSDGTRGLKRARGGSGIDPQTIRGVCELTKFSATQLDRLL
jgi:hypothetical protein